jgi:short-subunit dehydrogenase
MLEKRRGGAVARPGGATLITGAASGIGLALARLFAREGRDLLLCDLDGAGLERARAELATAGASLHDAAFDLSEPGAVEALRARATDLGLEVTTVVSCAGVGLLGDLVDSDAAFSRRMVRLHTETVHDLCHAFLPGMVARGGGRILNVASTAGFAPIPGFAAYAASKSFVLSLSEALHEELRSRGITVTCLCPGPTSTNFARAGRGLSPEKLASHRFVMAADEVAAAAYRGLQRGRAIVIPGAVNWLLIAAQRLGPRALVRRIGRRYIRSFG